LLVVYGLQAAAKVDPWESAADSIPPRGNPQGSVPIYGSAAPGFQYDRIGTLRR
jgi:hypothetical protein